MALRRENGVLAEEPGVEATLQFHAMCEGLVTLERQGMRVPFDAERIWRAGLGSLIGGFAVTSGTRA